MGMFRSFPADGDPPPALVPILIVDGTAQWMKRAGTERADGVTQGVSTWQCKCLVATPCYPVRLAAG